VFQINIIQIKNGFQLPINTRMGVNTPCVKKYRFRLLFLYQSYPEAMFQNNSGRDSYYDVFKYIQCIKWTSYLLKRRSANVGYKILWFLDSYDKGISGYYQDLYCYL